MGNKQMTNEEMAQARGDILTDNDMEDHGNVSSNTFSMEDYADGDYSDWELDNEESDEPEDSTTNKEKEYEEGEEDKGSEDDSGAEVEGKPDKEKDKEGSEDSEDKKGTSEEEGDDAEDTDSSKQHIPKPRFDEVISQRNELREQTNQLKEQNKILLETLKSLKGESGSGQGDDAGGETSGTDQGDKGDNNGTEEFDLQAKLKEHSEAVIDGDENHAARVMQEIFDYQKNFATQAANEAISQYVGKQESSAAQDVANSIFERHQEAFADEALVDDFVALRSSYQQRGYNMKDALVMAEKRLFGNDKLDSDDGGDAQSPGGDAQSPGGDQGKNQERAKEKKAEQKKEAVDRNADAAKRQPPKTGQSGSSNRSSGKPKSALEIPEKDYQDMTDEEKAKARGDIV